MNGDDLSFWIDSSSVDSSDNPSDDEPVSVTTDSKNQQKEKTHLPLPVTPPSPLLLTNSNTNQLTPEQIKYIQNRILTRSQTQAIQAQATEPPQDPTPSPQVVEYQKAYQSLQKEISNFQAQLDQTSDDENDIVQLNESSTDDSEGKVVFVRTNDGSINERIVLSKDGMLSDIFNHLPDQCSKMYCEVDGIKLSPSETPVNLVDEYSTITLIENQTEKQHEDLGNKFKLSFLLPDGTKRRFALDSDMTFQEVLVKIGFQGHTLLFDGEPIILTQKICDQDEIEEGDQIDVV